MTSLKLALVVLRSQAQTLRSSLSTLRIRHDFTKVNGRCIADRLWIISRLRIAATKVPTCLLYKADSIVDHRTFYGDQSGEKCVPIVLAIQTSPRRQVLFRRFRDEEWHRMALKVELKAGERFILGNCLITNSA